MQGLFASACSEHALILTCLWSIFSSFLEKRQTMKLSSQIKPIGYLKAHVAEIIRNLGERREPLIITQNGEAKAVLLDIESYEQTQQTLALLKILALGNRQIEEGKVQPAAEVIGRLRARREAR